MSQDLQPPEAVPAIPTSLYHSAMLRRFGALFHLAGLGLLMRKLQMSEESAETVRQAAAKGPVVYVMHTRSPVDYLALNFVLKRRRLPLANYGTGVSTTLWSPLLDALAVGRDKLLWFFRHGRLPNPVDVGWLTQSVARGQHAAVFLRRAPSLATLFEEESWPDPVPALLQAQERSERPIQLLPVVLQWQRAPEKAGGLTFRALAAAEESWGSFNKLLGAAFGQRSAVVQVGSPVDLEEYQDRFRGDDSKRQARRLRRLLRRHISQEQRVLTGPKLMPASWTRRQVLTSPRIQSLIVQESQAQSRPVRSIQKELLREYEKMAARMSFRGIRWAERAVDWLWKSLFQGIDVKPEDIEKVRAAKREGVAVLVPSHRSHLDYVLMTSVLHDNQVMIPHVIAGENLSFWPLGPFFRSFGAIFIKRSFSGERLFPTLLSAYLTHLFRQGSTVEFFIEGGRSRTGKCLPPKLGILGYTLESGLEVRESRPDSEVSWLPINITYEQVAEEKPYARELSGGEKEAESVGGLLRASRALFKRYGRVYLRIGDPIKLSEVCPPAEDRADWAHLELDERKARLQHLGERLVDRINNEAVVLPTGLVALALLAQAVPAVPGRVLAARIERFRQLLIEAGAELSRSLVHPSWARQEALARFAREGMVEELSGADDVVIQPVPKHRITLEYYKNSVMHLLLPGSLVAAVIRARGQERFTTPELLPLLAFQRELLRQEFILDPETVDTDLLGSGLAQLEHVGAIQAPDEQGRWTVLEKPRVGELAELTTNFLESYYLVLRAAGQLQGGSKEQVKELQRVGAQFLAVQDLRRPEALNAVNLRNALKQLQQMGALVPQENNSLALHPERGREAIHLLRTLLRIGDVGDESRLHGL